MITLQLGVLDVTYTQDVGGSSQTKTTGDVAEIIENKYHVMRYFFGAHKDEIATILTDMMANSLQQALASRSGGSARPPMHTVQAQSQIEALFRRFLDADELQRLSIDITGSAISQAALSGFSKRKKQPTKAGLGRAAFVDTGLYRSSFRAAIRF